MHPHYIWHIFPIHVEYNGIYIDHPLTIAFLVLNLIDI
jgi:hypothetical protein